MANNWTYPTTIKFGAGRVLELADACGLAGINNPLLVTDKGLALLPPLKIVCDILSAAKLRADFRPAVFCDIDGEPNENHLAAAVAAYNNGGHDGVIALGGGSALDIGKLVALMARQKISVWEMEDGDDGWRRADGDAVAPIIAVPTTAGTGSEVGRAGVLLNTKTRRKKIIFHPKIMPAVVVCDPQLTVGMPPSVTAGTGMDAFAHCLEAYCAPSFHPMSQGVALEGMSLVKNNLLNVYRNGDDINARGEMMAAAMMGAVAFQKGLGAIHSLSHAVGALYKIHHGTLNAVFMRAVLQFNRTAIENKIERVAAYLDVDGGFDGFCDYIGELRDALAIPKNLTALNIPKDNLDLLVQMALEDPTAAGNPVKMNSQNTRELLESCF